MGRPRKNPLPPVTGERTVDQAVKAATCKWAGCSKVGEIAVGSALMCVSHAAELSGGTPVVPPAVPHRVIQGPLDAAPRGIHRADCHSRNLDVAMACSCGLLPAGVIPPEVLARAGIYAQPAEAAQAAESEALSTQAAADLTMKGKVDRLVDACRKDSKMVPVTYAIFFQAVFIGGRQEGHIHQADTGQFKDYRLFFDTTRQVLIVLARRTNQAGVGMVPISNVKVMHVSPDSL